MMLSDPPPFIGPFDEAAALAEEIMNDNDEATVFQIFQCEACNRIHQGYDPNTFHEFGDCECGVETNLRASGCGFIAVIGDPEKVTQAAAEAAFAQYGQPKGLPS